MKKNSALRIERELRGWSQARVAEALNVSSKTVARWERGLAVPYPYYREQLSALFGKSLHELGLLPEIVEAEIPQSNELESPVYPAHPSSALIDPVIPGMFRQPDALLGRDDLLALMRDYLLERDSLAVTALNGLPGTGKTALALGLITDQAIQAQYRDGILWAGLGPHPDVIALLARWGRLLGVHAEDVEDPRDLESWRRALREAIGLRHMLLVIDDAWSSEDALVLRIGGNNCAHLLTTRSPQVAFAFAQLRTVVVPELREDDSLSLLARFVPRFVQRSEKVARELVRLVGGLPLAVELIGYYLASQSISGQPRRLRAAVNALQDMRQRMTISAPQRWQEHPLGLSDEIALSLQATIAISDQHLSQQAHNALCALSVFPARPNSFSEEAALAVSRQPAETLDELWDIGLLESSGPGRYMLHQTIVDYACSQGPVEPNQRRLVEYIVVYLRDHELEYDRIEQEFKNIAAALEVAVALDMTLELVEGVLHFVPYLRTRSRYSLADYYLRAALERVAPDDRAHRLLLLLYLAEFATLRQEDDLAARYQQELQGLLLSAEGDPGGPGGPE